MSKIIKLIDKRETLKQQQQQQQQQKENKWDGRYSERVRDKWFCWVFMLCFLQLICKGSLIFKSNLALALSIILKDVELHESKHVPIIPYL